jgi:hypothetical protein
MLYVTFHPTNRADNIAVLRQLRTHDTSRVPHFWRVNARKTARIKLGYYTLPREDGKRSQEGIGLFQPVQCVDPCVGTGNTRIY